VTAKSLACLGVVLAALGTGVAAGAGAVRAGDDRQVAPVAIGPNDATMDRPWVNSLGMKFVPVRGTTVLFCIWETRVKDFRAFVKDKGYEWNEKPSFKQTPNDPVVMVSHGAAKAFCAWLSKKEGLDYRLPTDDEWDAAVGKDKYPWGDRWPPPKGAENLAGEEAIIGDSGDPSSVIRGHRDDYPRTAPVGNHRATKTGLYDMIGNVREWTDDWYTEAIYRKQKESGGPDLRPEQLADIKSGQLRRVARGCHWWDSVAGIVVASRRFCLRPNEQNDKTGFRCVVVISRR